MALNNLDSDSNSRICTEFRMLDKDFQFLKSHAYEKVGIVLSDFKRDMVYSRLARRLRTLQLRDFSEYCHYLQTQGDSEFTYFVNAITTNFTSFFREQHHFDFLKETVIPEWGKRRGDMDIRVWSAGCSTGEEPYSIAMTLLDSREPFLRHLEILATDIDTNVLHTGRSGFYECSKATGLDEAKAKRWCEIVETNGVASYKMSDALRQVISFKRLNLLESWLMNREYDLIFCRNVVIYFNKETQAALFQRYYNQLKPGGYLIVGHSETLKGIFDGFEQIGGTIYRKTDQWFFVHRRSG